MSSDQSAEQTSSQRRPTCVLLLGMAGSGKTATMQRLQAHMVGAETPLRPYVLNLDPAVSSLPYEPNLDIRDTVDYAGVMKQYELGPNGAIMTALSLFATKFDQVLGILNRRAPECDYVLVDTPGQIEVFTWSASGAIVANALAADFPCVVVYVVDTPRSVSPPTFVANMLFACSIMYRLRLPFVLAFNKTDAASPERPAAWIRDSDELISALEEESARCVANGGDVPYMNSFVRSMAVVLEEFYSVFQDPVFFSAATGEGTESLVAAIDRALKESDTK